MGDIGKTGTKKIYEPVPEGIPVPEFIPEQAPALPLPEAVPA